MILKKMLIIDPNLKRNSDIKWRLMSLNPIEKNGVPNLRLENIRFILDRYFNFKLFKSPS